MKTWFIVAFCLFFSSISLATQTLFSNLIVFGDSLSDAASLSPELNLLNEKEHGNNYWVHVQGKIGAPVTSLNPNTHVAAIWPNYLVANTTLFENNPNHTRYIYPVRQAAQLGYSPLTYNIDYAWASAETGDDYLNDLDLNGESGSSFVFPPYNTQVCESSGAGYISKKRSCVPGVIMQVKTYLRDVQERPNPKSLFIIWAGGNDIFNNAAKIVRNNKEKNHFLLLLKMLNAAFPLRQDMGIDAVSNPVLNIKQAVVLLIKAGVSPEHIYVINLPNFADIPAAQSIAQDRKTVLYLWTLISGIFNVTLTINLAFDYRYPEFNLPKSNIISSNAFLTQMLEHQKQYGFSMGSQDCMQNHRASDCQGYIFFNDKHPTSITHQKIADHLIQVLYANSHV